MIFTISAKSQPNQKKVAIGRAGTLKMEAWCAENDSPRRQHDSRELLDEAQERQYGPSECPHDCPDGPWQPNLLLKVLPKVNLSAPGRLRDASQSNRSTNVPMILGWISPFAMLANEHGPKGPNVFGFSTSGFQSTAQQRLHPARPIQGQPIHLKSHQPIVVAFLPDRVPISKCLLCWESPCHQAFSCHQGVSCLSIPFHSTPLHSAPFHSTNSILGVIVINCLRKTYRSTKS